MTEIYKAPENLNVLKHFHPVLAADKLSKTPVRVTVAGHRMALFRSRGNVAAVNDICPHRFASLSQGSVDGNGHLACAYHGWTFDSTGKGQMATNDNRPCQIQAYTAVEKFGFIWVQSVNSDLAFPEMTESGYDFMGGFSVPFKAPLVTVLDNFGEDSHTPWVHTRFGWKPEQMPSVLFDCEIAEASSKVKYQADNRYSPLGHLIGVKKGDKFNNHFTSHFSPIHFIYHIFWTSPAGLERPFKIRATVFLVPEDDLNTNMHVFISAQTTGLVKRALPLTRKIVMELFKKEIQDDADFMPVVAATTPIDSMRGMKLDKYDKPLVHNRELVKKIYWGI